jgi:hypothetical protein
MKHDLLTIATGAAGVTAVEVVNQLPSPSEMQSIGSLIIQIIVGLITIFKLLKKDKPKKPNTTAHS